MHEYRVRLCHSKNPGIDLIRCEELYALCPDALGLAHGNPDVRVEDIRAIRALGYIFCKCNAAAVFLSNCGAFFHKSLRRKQGLRGAGREVYTHFRAADHQGIAHIVSRVAEIGEVQALETPFLLLDRKQIREHLGGMELIRKPVPYGNSGIPRQYLHSLLPEAPEFYPVVHSAEYMGGIRDRFLFAHLAVVRAQESHAHAEIHTRDLERAARARGGLFEKQDYVPAFQIFVKLARLFLLFEVPGQVEKTADLLRAVVEQSQETATFEFGCHILLLTATPRPRSPPPQQRDRRFRRNTGQRISQ